MKQWHKTLDIHSTISDHYEMPDYTFVGHFSDLWEIEFTILQIFGHPTWTKSTYWFFKEYNTRQT